MRTGALAVGAAALSSAAGAAAATSGLGAADILDWSLAPYLNYGANPPGSAFAGPVGYVVTPGMGGSIATAARIYTSTNATADDPADFTLYGSNDGVTWSLIDYTPLALPYVICKIAMMCFGNVSHCNQHGIELSA